MGMEKEVLLDIICTSISEGIHVVDKQGKTLVYNQAMAALEGLTVEEVLDKELLEVLPSLKGNSTLMEALSTGQPIIDRLQTYFNAQGKEITTLNSTWPVMNKGAIIGAVEVARDISKTKELAEKIVHLQGDLCKQNSNNYRKRKIKYTFDHIIGESPQIIEVKQTAMMASKTSSNVLIIGESGTGKELFAQSIHNAGKHSQQPFIAQNCAALPESLLEGILFGTVKGGFTGAVDRSGLFQQADGGTLLLDEINAMPLGLQAKLLRVIQEGKCRPVGSSREIEVDVRLIAVTNEDPLKAISEGKLREDLFYRLSVVNLFIPPLRERQGDKEILLEYFINALAKKFNKKIAGVDNEVKKFIAEHHWPGNVRELAHVLEGAINLTNDGEVITLKHLPYYLKRYLPAAPGKNLLTKMTGNINNLPQLPGKDFNLEKYLYEIEDQLISEALRLSKGNISKAAESLGISRQGLQYKLKKIFLKEFSSE